MNSWTTNSRTFRTFLLLMEVEPEKIRARLRQARKEAGLSQAAMAELLKVHKRSVENYVLFVLVVLFGGGDSGS
jgi:DNA-binding transcriptional regulator YiaG